MTPTLTPTPSPPWRRTAVVAAVVVLLHVLVLLGLPLQLPELAGQAPEVVTQARLIAPPPPPPAPPPVVAPPAPVPPAPAAARPTPRPHPPSAQPQPRPAPSQRPVAEAPAVQAAPDAAGVTAPVPGIEPGGSTAAAGTAGDAEALTANGPSSVHEPVRLSFEMLGQRGVQPWKGVFGQLDWQQDGQRYEAKLAVKLLFRTIRSQASSGRIVDGALVPERFSETRRQEDVTTFQRDQGQALFGNGAPAAALRPGAQDRLSVVLQLAALMAGDAARHPAGSRIAIQTVGTRDAEIWTFEVEGDEAVAVPAGQYTARRLVRTPRRADDYRLELWLAPDLGWLPVRMRQTQANGDVIDLQLREATRP